MSAAASSVLEPGQFRAMVEIKISYLASMREGKVVAETAVAKKGRQIVFLESKARDEVGRLIAIATGSFMILSRAE